MARVTVEDCVEKIPNRFELVMLSSQRTRQIGAGAPLKVDRDNDKNAVVSLREIADEEVTPEELKEELIKNHQRVIEVEDSEDVIDLMEGEEEWNSIAAQAAEIEAAGMDMDAVDDNDDSDDEASLADVAGN